MTPNPLTALTDLAVRYFPFLNAERSEDYMLPVGDPVYDALKKPIASFPRYADDFETAISIIFPKPEFDLILAKEDDRTPMVLTDHGGSRISPISILLEIFLSAWQQIFLLGLSRDETTFVEIVIQNYKELQKAMRGEKVRVFTVNGIAGISLSKDVHASTPWGRLYPAAEVEEAYPLVLTGRPTTTCILFDERRLSVGFDLSANPEHKVDESEDQRDPRANFLFQLSCVLSLEEPAMSSGPIWTWATWFLPFLSVHGGSFLTHHGNIFGHRNMDASVSALEHWSEMVAFRHSEGMDFSASRLVSSIVYRADYADSLVDAVMVWENLFGAESEVSFRVTAALSKLLLPDAGVEERKKFREKLRKAYDTRSRIVHGRIVDLKQVQEDRNLAVSVAVRALREFYSRESEWHTMPSRERAEALLLGG